MASRVKSFFPTTIHTFKRKVTHPIITANKLDITKNHPPKFTNTHKHTVKKLETKPKTFIERINSTIRKSFSPK